MGTFISMSGIINKSQEEVLQALSSYFKYQHKKLKLTALNTEIYKLFLLYENENNSIILYPKNFSEYNEIALYLADVFSSPIINFNIYNDNLWTYEVYFNGQIIDYFNPIAQRTDNKSDKVYVGNPKIVCNFCHKVELNDIKEYYRLWTNELIINKQKAYSDDEFAYGENWQVVDFMRKLNLKYPITDEEETIGSAFKLI